MSNQTGGDEKETTNAPVTYERTTVWIRRNSSANYEPAPFDICFFDYFDIKENMCEVEFNFKDNKVFLQLSNARKTKNKPKKKRMVYILEHPSFCAVHRLQNPERENLPQVSLHRGVDVGVSVIVESSDHKILISRRAPHMRTFPGVWVPPGGHVEEGETLEEAGLREVYEEVGLSLTEYKGKCIMLGLWESCFPPVLYVGMPKRHHLVFYLLLKLELASNVLLESIKLDYNETDACTWLDKNYIEIVLDRKNVPDYDKVPILAVNTEGEHFHTTTNAKFLKKKMPFPDHEVERITTGTRFALKLWLQQKYKPS